MISFTDRPVSGSSIFACSLAGIFGFDKMEKFEADAAAQNAPTVKF